MLTMPRRSRLKLSPVQLVTDESFGQRFARLRKERGYTQVELAAKTGLTQALVTDYERGRLRMHAEMVVRFAQCLDVSTDELLGVSDAAKKKGGSTLSLKLIRRLQKIEQIPNSKQKALLQTIDGFLKGAGVVD